jgi:hypothetical protein
MAFSIGDGRHITRGRCEELAVSQEISQREQVLPTETGLRAIVCVARGVVEKRRRKQGRRRSCASPSFEGDQLFEGNQRRKKTTKETPKERGKEPPKDPGAN